jgi:hypothetical protein
MKHWPAATLFSSLASLSGFAPHARAYTLATASETGAPAHWEAQTIGFELSGSTASISSAEAAEILDRCLAQWERIGCHSLLLESVGAGEQNDFSIDGTNRIVWQKVVWPGSPVELAVTRLTRHASTGEIVDADILFNERDYNFHGEPPGNAGGLDSYDFEGVLLHELGHALGLGHSEFPGATMAAQAAGEPANLRNLSADDRLGACHLYEPQPLQGQQGAYRPTRPQSAAPDPSPTWILAFLLPLALWPGKQRWLALALASAQCDSSGNAPALSDTGDISPDSGHTDADLPEPSLDATFADATDGDISDEPPDGSGVADVGALLRAAPAWQVLSVSTTDINDAAEDLAQVVPFAADPEAPTLLVFAEAGGLRLVRRGEVDKACALQNSWDVTAAGELLWRWEHSPQFCPGRRALREEVLEVQASQGGGLVLRLVEGRFSVGASGRPPRPYEMHLSPWRGPLDLTPCPPLPAPPPCSLQCGENDYTDPASALSCAPPAELASCSGAPLGEGTRTCVVGCYEVTCTQSAGSGTCDEASSALTCEW